jgi:hypothetical protein
MARLFDDANPDAYITTSAVVTSMPLTMAAWFYTDQLTTNQSIVTASSEDDNAFHGWWLQMRGGEFGDYVAARSYGGGSSRMATTSGGATINVWHHACAVFASDVSRSVYIDGGSKGTDTNSSSPLGVDNIGIGSIYYWTGSSNDFSSPMSGRIAEAAVWNAALTDDEVAVLAAGFSPLFVRPQSLVFYVPLVRTVLDRVDNVGFTTYGTPTVAAHPPIIHPAQVHQSFAAAAAPPAGISIPVAMRYYRNMRT